MVVMDESICSQFSKLGQILWDVAVTRLQISAQLSGAYHINVAQLLLMMLPSYTRRNWSRDSSEAPVQRGR